MKTLQPIKWSSFVQINSITITFVMVTSTDVRTLKFNLDELKFFRIVFNLYRKSCFFLFFFWKHLRLLPELVSLIHKIKGKFIIKLLKSAINPGLGWRVRPFTQGTWLLLKNLEIGTTWAIDHFSDNRKMQMFSCGADDATRPLPRDGGLEGTPWKPNSRPRPKTWTRSQKWKK